LCGEDVTVFKEERMPVHALKERAAHADMRDGRFLEAGYLLRRLVESTTAEASDAPPRVFRRTDECVDEIIFAAEIEGAQYYVVRSRPLVMSQVSLSPREQAIARLIAQGLPNKCIADILEISPWTVATYLRRIFIKLNVTSRAAMVARLVGEHVLQL
jgi:DNA-binding CsgD family transcriptional regulator